LIGGRPLPRFPRNGRCEAIIEAIKPLITVVHQQIALIDRLVKLLSDANLSQLANALDTQLKELVGVAKVAAQAMASGTPDNTHLIAKVKGLGLMSKAALDTATRAVEAAKSPS